MARNLAAIAGLALRLARQAFAHYATVPADFPGVGFDHGVAGSAHAVGAGGGGRAAVAGALLRAAADNQPGRGTQRAAFSRGVRRLSRRHRRD